MKGLVKFLKDRSGVSAVIGVILMVAITVVMSAVVAAFAYGFRMPMVAPSMAATLVDDPRVTLRPEVNDGRVAILNILMSPTIAEGELVVIVTYTDASGEYTKRFDGLSWVTGNAETVSIVAMSPSPAIGLKWWDSDESGDITAGDRLEFWERGTETALEVLKKTDFRVMVIHKPSEATLVDQTIKVY